MRTGRILAAAVVGMGLAMVAGVRQPMSVWARGVAVAQDGQAAKDAAVAQSAQTDGEARTVGQWRQLFDGKDLAGWSLVGPGGFAVRDGLLRSDGGMGLLVWDGGPVGQCELRVVYRMTAKNSNSGVFMRVPEKPADPWVAVNTGFEVQIDNEDDMWHRTGTLYSFTEAKASPGKPGPEWNTMEIRLEGARTTVRVNGVLVTDFTEGPGWTPRPRVHTYEPKVGPRPERGWIGLQNHGKDDVVEFREVALRPLP